MGLASSTRALATCTTKPYSTIFDDLQLARQDREASDTLSSRLWRLTHGNSEEFALYDNALDFLSLQAEMGAWVRANRTVGMNPSAYEAVVRGAAAVLGLKASLLEKPLVEIPARLASLSDVGQVNWTLSLTQCSNDSSCIQQVTQDAYRLHANASLRAAPHMIVSNATFTRARKYYAQALFPGSIVRSFQLDPATTRYSFDRNLRGLLRAVQQMWDGVTREAEAESKESERRGEGDSSRASSIPGPYLPFLRETDITGPERPETKHLTFTDPAYPRHLRHSGVSLQPLQRILPTAVLYQTSADCTSCGLFDRAFDILPAVYKRLCNHNDGSIVSCSPITLFIRTTHVRSFQMLPSMELYARLAYSRRAVLRLADLSLRQDQKKNLHDTEDGDDTPSVGGSAFYSVEMKYGKWSAGIEDEVLPRTQFKPEFVPLRLQANVATVEEAVVSFITELVGKGVIQFIFLDAEEVSQITAENERVKKMLREQQEKQQEDGVNGTREERDKEAISKNSSSSDATAPPSPNPEDHPRYRKLVSFGDLAAKLVAAHTRAVFGDVGLVQANPTHRRGSWRRGGGSLSNAGGAAELSAPAPPPWWASSWMVRVLRAVWDLLFSGIERPLYLTVFALLCLYQRWWNRWHQVSYW
ncbi:hypothetical protein ABB37_00334 [Leptomonas pyrrhocoris]|uniref:Uncharacterized protein n=1 Tax=Leptomonas pyrrhocoris TaxID=157538 RepID=A0A0M9GAI6_LEPPY|nr:hypothetical protein ABB37_00334 [Leptomonas pyrrhocoris]KPA86066.1 hypothetical protein ABB37_00334 [Leptomonas pyrrhocoris]|eukprot:XP_015664505.1 hypothetical protein ABB37_00334 [Leptomonas pyrrhocoris]